MKRFILIFLFAWATQLTAIAQGIRFEQGTWSEVKAKAKAEKKPIFVDAYTTWCGPCKKMAREVFTKEAVGRYFNSTFINYQLDMEKGEGIEFAKQYEVIAFPTLLYFDSDGRLAFKAIGAKDENGLLSQAKLALNPEYQLATYKKEYEEGGKTISDLTRYVNKLREGGSYAEVATIVSEYFKNMGEKERISMEGFRLVSNYIFDYKSEAFEYVLQHRKQYADAAGTDLVHRYLFNALAIRTVPGSRGADSRETYYGTLAKYSKYIPVDYFVARMQYFENLAGDPDSCFRYAKNLFEKKYAMVYPDDKLSYYKVFMANRYIGESGERFQSALKWAQDAVAENENDYKGTFVLAQLLYKAGKKQEALKWAIKSKEAFAANPEAPVMQRLFRADQIGPFIEKLQSE